MKFKGLSFDQRIIRAAVGAVLLILIVFSFGFDPSTYHLMDCYFNDATGLPCPSCGLTRSFYAMAHLQFVEAFQLNWMGPVLFFMIVAIGFYMLAAALAGKALLFPNQSKNLKLGFILLLLVWLTLWLVRMCVKV